MRGEAKSAGVADEGRTRAAEGDSRRQFLAPLGDWDVQKGFAKNGDAIESMVFDTVTVSFDIDTCCPAGNWTPAPFSLLQATMPLSTATKVTFPARTENRVPTTRTIVLPVLTTKGRVVSPDLEIGRTGQEANTATIIVEFERQGGIGVQGDSGNVRLSLTRRLRRPWRRGFYDTFTREMKAAG
jgi:hypothetical protein